MCDYGRTDKVQTVDKYIDEMHKILSENSNGIEYLLLCTNGSFFDENQIPKDLFRAILQCAQNCDIPKIIIETHCNDVSAEKLRIVKSIIHKPLIIEMGFETANQNYHDKVILKGINIKKYENIIELIHSNGINIELNIMLGLPFLSTKEQIEDAKCAIDWAIAHNCDPVVFPINIKPHTLLWEAYKNGFYKPISIWLLIKLLNTLAPESLSRVIIAWYGNRDESYQNDIPVQLPSMCELCKPKIMAFCKSFLLTNNYIKRKDLISRLIKDTHCNCRLSLDEEPSLEYNFETNYKKFYDFLQRKYK